VLVVETFTDPARHRGGCYAAAGFAALGQTLGYRRSAGAYVHHGDPKLAWAPPLRRDALVMLSALFDHPVLSAHPRTAVIDLNAVELDGPKGRLATLAQLPDAHKRRGIRHRQASVLAIAAAAVLAGARSYTAIGEYAPSWARTCWPVWEPATIRSPVGMSHRTSRRCAERSTGRS
jgi:DDE family transposase